MLYDGVVRHRRRRRLLNRVRPIDCSDRMNVEPVALDWSQVQGMMFVLCCEAGAGMMRNSAEFTRMLLCDDVFALEN